MTKTDDYGEPIQEPIVAWENLSGSEQERIEDRILGYTDSNKNEECL